MAGAGAGAVTLIGMLFIERSPVSVQSVGARGDVALAQYRTVWTVPRGVVVGREDGE